MIQQELAAEKRIVLDSPGFVAFCPFASRFPFETWILPKQHSSHYENIQKSGVDDLARVMRQVIAQIESAVDRPAYNYIIHTAPFDSNALGHYHWHIEIIPRLTKTAGFEWGTGFYINPVPPEEAAAFLRDVEDRTPQTPTIRNNGLWAICKNLVTVLVTSHATTAFGSSSPCTTISRSAISTASSSRRIRTAIGRFSICSSDYPQLQIALHTSGPLMEWLDDASSGVSRPAGRACRRGTDRDHRRGVLRADPVDDSAARSRRPDSHATAAGSKDRLGARSAACGFPSASGNRA